MSAGEARCTYTAIPLKRNRNFMAPSLSLLRTDSDVIMQGGKRFVVCVVALSFQTCLAAVTDHVSSIPVTWHELFTLSFRSSSYGYSVAVSTKYGLEIMFSKIRRTRWMKVRYVEKNRATQLQPTACRKRRDLALAGGGASLSNQTLGSSVATT